jgi:hypothetical protein
MAVCSSSSSLSSLSSSSSLFSESFPEPYELSLSSSSSPFLLFFFFFFFLPAFLLFESFLPLLRLPDVLALHLLPAPPLLAGLLPLVLLPVLPRRSVLASKSLSESQLPDLSLSSSSSSSSSLLEEL